MSQGVIPLTSAQIKAIAKLRDERRFASVELQASGGDCGCVHLIDHVHFVSWRIDQEGRVQG